MKEDFENVKSVRLHYRYDHVRGAESSADEGLMSYLDQCGTNRQASRIFHSRIEIIYRPTTLLLVLVHVMLNRFTRLEINSIR